MLCKLTSCEGQTLVLSDPCQFRWFSCGAQKGREEGFHPPWIIIVHGLTHWTNGPYGPHQTVTGPASVGATKSPLSVWLMSYDCTQACNHPARCEYFKHSKHRRRTTPRGRPPEPLGPDWSTLRPLSRLCDDFMTRYKTVLSTMRASVLGKGSDMQASRSHHSIAAFLCVCLNLKQEVHLVFGFTFNLCNQSLLFVQDSGPDPC